MMKSRFHNSKLFSHPLPLNPPVTKACHDDDDVITAIIYFDKSCKQSQTKDSRFIFRVSHCVLFVFIPAGFFVACFLPPDIKKLEDAGQNTTLGRINLAFDNNERDKTRL